MKFTLPSYSYSLIQKYRSSKIALLIAAILIIACSSIYAFNPNDVHPDGKAIFTNPKLLIEQGDSLAAAGLYDKALSTYILAANRASANNFDGGKEVVNAINAYLCQTEIYITKFFDYSSALRALDNADDLCVRFKISAEPVDFQYGVLYFTIAEMNDSKEFATRASAAFSKAYKDASKNDNEPICHYAMSNMLLCEPDVENKKKIDQLYNEYVKTKPTQIYDHLYNFNVLMHDVISGELNDLDEIDRRCSNILSDGKLPRSRYYPYVLYVMTRNARKAGKIQEAITLVHKGMESTSEEEGGDIMLTFYKLLYELYKEIGDDASASKYYVKYADIKEKVSSFSQIMNLRSVEVQRDMNNLQKNLDDEQNYSRTLTYWIIVAVVFILIVLIVAYILLRTNRRIRETNRMLFDKNAELMRAEEEKRHMRQSAAEQSSTIETTSAIDLDDNSKSATIKAKAIENKINAIFDTSEEIWNSEFSASRLAELVGVGYTTLSQVINSQFGMNFHQLIGDRRIKEVCRRINESDEYDNLSVDAIANEVGIKSRTTFSTIFKRVTGMTPSVYIKIARQRRQEE